MKKLSLLVCSFLIVTLVMGQGRISLPFSSAYDEDAVLLLGIQYNYVNQNYQLKLSENWQTYSIGYEDEQKNILGNPQSIHSHNSHGFSVSIPLDVRANPNLYFNFSPSFLFINNSGIDYTSQDSTKTSLRRRTRHTIGNSTGTNFNTFEFPLAVKFRSDEKYLKNKFNRYRAYMLGGVRYSRLIGINKEYRGWENQQREKVPDPLIVKPQHTSWEVGLGADIFFPYFKVSPEIRFSQSFGSVLDKTHKLVEGNQFMAPLEKAYLRNIYVSLIFQ